MPQREFNAATRTGLYTGYVRAPELTDAPVKIYLREACAMPVLAGRSLATCPTILPCEKGTRSNSCAKPSINTAAQPSTTHPTNSSAPWTPPAESSTASSSNHDHDAINYPRIPRTRRKWEQVPG